MRLPRTLGGQLIALLLTALAVSQIVAFLIYSDERSSAIREADRMGLLENTASVLRILWLSPPELRQQLARAASSPRVRIWITPDSVLSDPGPSGAVPSQVARLFAEPVRERVRIELVANNTAPAMAQRDRRFAVEAQRLPFQNEVYDVIVSAPLPDGGWVNAQTELSAQPISWAWASTASSAVMAIAILAIVAVMARRATHPLRSLAYQADALGRGSPGQPLTPKGPDEMRRVTTAFNGMQDRLQRFVADRTRMIAAIGHDLRTPITSLKIRAELLDDDEAKAKMLATLDEMQRMVEATLAFAKDEAIEEEARSVDLAALVTSVVDDHADMGKDVRFTETARLPYRCRPNTLRRAVSNLIDNAVKYGGRARVTLSVEDSGPVISVEDRGPGVPEDRLDDIFKPFVRLEESRSSTTGGVGLGLSIARSMVLAHGGELMLSNRLEGGLRADIRLPAEG